jgi:hypothetical protein
MQFPQAFFAAWHFEPFLAVRNSVDDVTTLRSTYGDDVSPISQFRMSAMLLLPVMGGDVWCCQMQ